MRFVYFGLLLLLGNPFAYSQSPSYREKYRPQFHFSPPAHWMNDPNGMVYNKGEYHLFYQYYPDSTVWGPMHWGHAVSKDLVHWQHLPIALYPDSLGYIFSGSVVVDQHNSSGFGKGNEVPLVAIFTYHNMDGEKAKRNDFQTQGIAYSTDNGRSWTKYKNNPVIKNPGLRDFRDPKVMWHEASKHWVLTMAAGDEIRFYHSTNLKDWTFTGSFGKKEGSHGGVWECPDLFEMKTAEGESKWVLLVSIGSGAANGGSGTQYFTGHFDGKNFTNDAPASAVKWLDYGKDNYAGVTWSNTPGHRLFIGWMSNWQYAQTVPTEKWRSAMTLPRELYLQKTAGNYLLITKPAKETKALRNGSAVSIPPGKPVAINKAEIEITYELPVETSENIGIELSNKKGEKIRIGYSAAGRQFYIDRTKLAHTEFSKDFPGLHTAPRMSNSRQVKLQIFIDKSSVEVFADDGMVVLTDIFFPKEDLSALLLFGQTGQTKIQEAKMYSLKSIW